MTYHPRRRSVHAIALATTTATLSLGIMVPTASAQEIATFSISNFTDLHGHIAQVASGGNVTEPGAAVLSSMVKHVNAGQEYLLTSSGDNVGGSAFLSAVLDDEPTLAVLNQMGLHASAVGNHEFDKGYDDLTGRIQPFSNFDYLGANVTGGTPALKPYVVKEVAGVRVALIGSVTETTKNKVSPAGIVGIDFDDPIAATNALADEITATNQADVVVALFHEGVEDPNAFNANVDAVFAGDTHETESQVIKRADGSAFAVAQAYEYGKALADMDFTFDKQSGKVTDITSTVYDTAQMMAAVGNTPDLAVAAIVEQAMQDSEVAGNRVVATAAASFYRGANEDSATSSGSNRGVESTLSNALAQAAKDAITNNTSITADLGVMNAGGVRADLLEGEVTYQEAFAVQPFGNEITYTSLTGQDIINAIEQQWKDPSASRPVLALGWSDNFTYTYNPQAEAGKRFIAGTIDGQPLDPAALYVVAGSTFLLEGGDGFPALANGSKLTNTGLMDVTAFTEFLANNPTLTPRGGQSAVGMQVSGDLAPGAEVTFDLSSLLYTVGDSASTVTLSVGETIATADIARDFGPANFGEAGTASLKLTVPGSVKATDMVTITTDAGTRLSFELGALGGVMEAEGASENPASQDPSEDPAPVGSSTGFGFFGLFALIALLFSAANNAVGSVLSAWFAPLQALLASSSAN
ncbi:bifunctional metallophosphatase/5'-nucleotidase [Corynebacterium sp. 35RC1]|nr:bifunctional metallophosphatase/5'-nucleotidase [Corynebacterium sp. 35RC1]